MLKQYYIDYDIMCRSDVDIITEQMFQVVPFYLKYKLYGTYLQNTTIYHPVQCLGYKLVNKKLGDHIDRDKCPNNKLK